MMAMGVHEPKTCAIFGTFAILSMRDLGAWRSTVLAHVLLGMHGCPAWGVGLSYRPLECTPSNGRPDSWDAHDWFSPHTAPFLAGLFPSSTFSCVHGRVNF